MILGAPIGGQAIVGYDDRGLASYKIRAIAAPAIIRGSGGSSANDSAGHESCSGRDAQNIGHPGLSTMHDPSTSPRSAPICPRNRQASCGELLGGVFGQQSSAA